MISSSKYKARKTKNGFSLIEMLVVVFVVGVGLIGALSFFNININHQFEAKQELVAAGLAQEASELVRSLADNSDLNNLAWYEEIINIDDEEDHCLSIDREILSESGDNFQCRSLAAKSDTVCFDPGAGVYHQAMGSCPAGDTTTDFKRSLEIVGSEQNGSSGINLDTGDCLEVTATVGWPNSDDGCRADINDCPRKTRSVDILCKPRQ